MSDEIFNEKLTEFTAILDAFAAQQRSEALLKSRSQRLTFVRQIEGQAQLSFEAVIDEEATPEEIFSTVDRVVTASDRLVTKARMADSYDRISLTCGQIEVGLKQMAKDRIKYDAENAKHNASRNRQIVGLTDSQIQQMKDQRTGIDALFAEIEKYRAGIAECRRILAGADPLEIVEGQIAERLDKLRGNREEAA